MKKFLLLATLACMGMSAYAKTYYCGKNVATPDELTSGKYFLYSYTKGAGAFLHITNYYGGDQSLTEISATGLDDETYIYEIAVSEVNGVKTFTIKANNGKYFSIQGAGAEGKGNITVGNMVDESSEKIAQYIFADTEMGQPTNFDGKLYSLQLNNGHFEGNSEKTSYVTTNGNSAAAHLSYWESNDAVFPNTDNHFNGIAFFKASETPIGVSLSSDFHIPTVSGWYAIQTRTTTNPDHKGMWLINADEEFQQSANNCYALRLDDKNFFEVQTTPARGIVYVEVDGNNKYIRSINGHYATSKGVCKVSDSEPNFSVPEMTFSVQFTAESDGNNKTCNIGNYWMEWIATGTFDSNPNGYIFNGAGGSNKDFSYGFYAAKPELNYDIWTVTIENETYQSTVKKNLRVTLNHPQNAGIASVYHNGNFFLPKGSTIAESNLSVISNDAHTDMTAAFTIDNNAHIIKVTMSHPSELLPALLDQYKEEHRANHVAQLAATPWFNAETAADKIATVYNDITIADADLNEEGLKVAKAKVDASAIKAVREIIDGKKIYMASGSKDNNGNFDNIVGVKNIGENVLHVTPTDPVNIDAAWVIDFTDDTHVTLRNIVYNIYLNGLLAGTKTDATPFKFDFAVANNGLFTFQNESVSGNNYLNQSASQRLGYWVAGNNNAGSFWSISFVTHELEQTWINNAIAMLDIPQEKFGDEPGSFIDAEGRAEKLEDLKNLNPATSEIDYLEIREILAGSSAYNVALFDMHGIESTALIRIKSYAYANGYMTDNGKFEILETPGDETIFVLENIANDNAAVDGNATISSLSGHYLINKTNEAKLYIHVGENATDNTPTVFRFFNTYAPSMDGYYGVGFINGVNTNSKYSILSVSNGTFNHYSGDHYRTDYLTSQHMDTYFSVEYVKELTVGVEDGCKLWRTPVTVMFNEDNSGAYVVSVDGTKITTESADRSSSYGAGTIFILTKPVSLTVQNGLALNVPTAGLGHHAKQMHTLKANKAYLSISTGDTPSVVAMNDDGNIIKMAVKISDADTQVPLGAHEALIEADNIDLTNGDIVDLKLGSTFQTTAIAEVTAEGRTADSIYDLQGRKLAAPVKGVNIINGKKVLVK